MTKFSKQAKQKAFDDDVNDILKFMNDGDEAS